MTAIIDSGLQDDGLPSSETSTSYEHDQKGAADVSTPKKPGIIARLLRESRYVFVSSAIALSAFVLAITGVSLGMTLLVFVVGIPALTLTVHIARNFAHQERKMIGAMEPGSAPTPRYLQPAPNDSWWNRTVTPLRDPQSWLDLVFCTVGLVTALLSWCITVIWWGGAIGGLTWGLWGWALPADANDLPELLGFGAGYTNRLGFYFVLGVFFTLTLPFAVRMAAFTHSGLSRALLCSRAEMQEQVANLEQGRAAHRTAESSALRKLERDIHDGPQQRLVRLSMDLGRAKKQMTQDPESAGETLDAATSQARDTLEELRALSRGIAPPILVDRGLEAALVEATARCVIPVELDVRLGGENRRLDDHVEQAAYFLVSESLTNIAKHSGAAQASVSAVVNDGKLRITVTDDGVGGAHLSKGHGLLGLSDRIRAVDGILNVDSPAGGPTTIETEIPCA
ncbi:MAG TPA: sensor histidine kinase [Candidatus Stackebrandtia faecavium]|nr:sensor histidine kinase [Candidatus Stackebrandtia faecavium]